MTDADADADSEGAAPGPEPGRRAELGAALDRLETRIAAACAAAGRGRSEVRLIAVSKTRPASDVAALRDLGVHDFGESKDQEAGRKAAAVPDVRWHFVGRLQRNKARSVASYADVVHSLDRAPLVAALSDGAVRAGRTLQVLLQISLDDDPSRGGAAPRELPALADAVAASEGLRLGGVMAVAPAAPDPGESFAKLAGLAASLRRDHPDAVVVSAGMSGDLEQAVQHGATHLRVGGALFGLRPPLSR